MSTTDPKAAIRAIINAAHTAFLVTHNKATGPHGRPMATAQVDEKVEELWFASQRDTLKIEELGDDDRVFLGYTVHTKWATITGRGRIVDDRTKAKEIWSDVWKNWFSGPDDPNLVLIQVIPEQGEYWDGGSKVVQMLKFATTAITGAKTSPGAHASVKL
jgi:general stress protein 26